MPFLGAKYWMNPLVPRLPFATGLMSAMAFHPCLNSRSIPHSMPPETTLLDHHANRLGAPSFPASLRPAHLQRTKDRSPDDEPRIIELTRENSSLRQELARCQEVLEGWTVLYGTITEAYKLLKMAKDTLQEGLQVFSEKQAAADKKLCEYWGIDVEKGDYRVI